MSKKMGSIEIVTPTFRASYPSLFAPRANKFKNNQLEYSVDALFPKNTDLAPIKEAIKKVYIQTWGADQKKWPKEKWPILKDQADRGKEDEKTGKMVYPGGYEPGAFYMKLKTVKEIGLFNGKREAIIDESEIYPGVWLKAHIRIYAYNHDGISQGVTTSLLNVQKVKDGESLGGASRPSPDAFSEVESDDADGVFGD